MRIISNYILAIAFLCIGWSIDAQSDLILHILLTDCDKKELSKEIDLPVSEQKDSASIINSLTQLIEDLQQAAYWEASIDTLIQVENKFTAFLHRGPRYRWASLAIDSVPSAWLSAIGFRRRQFQGDFSPIAWQNLQEKLSREASKRGFPFAKVSLQNIQWQGEGQLSAQIAVDKGPAIILTEISIPNEAKIKRRFLENYLDIQTGTPYDQSKVEKLDQRLRELPFLKIKGPASIQFVGQEASIDLPIERQAASRFDFIIGVLPNSGTTGQLVITGQLDAELRNSLGQGEQLQIAFEQIRPQTQDLQIAVQYPYLLNLPFGLDLGFELYRRDTNFINLDQRIGLDYPLDGQRSIQAFFQWQNTNLLRVDSLLLNQSGRLPDTLDVNRSYFGLAFQTNNLDYRPNPRKGSQLLIQAGAGTKRIRRNNRILDLGLESLYDSLTLRSAQYRLELDGALYFPLGQNASLKTGLRAAAIISPTPLFANEQFRIGGNQLLRGFNEESIFASNYAVATVEARYLIGVNSFAYLFGDFARVDSSSQGSSPDSDPIDFPFGFGAGISFETPAGLFGLSLAFGRRNALPLDIGKPKVHLGYISRF